MKIKEFVFSLFLFSIIAIIFFYKTFFFGKISFPGDLLTSEFNPWKSYSYLGFLPGTIPNKAQYGDTIRQIYPWRKLTTEVLKKVNFPLWNPYNFSGQPLWANAQATVLYPLNIFYFIFSNAVSWQINIIAQTFLASLFTYLFARKIGLNKLSAFFSSVAFSYSLFMTVFLEYNTIDQVIAFLPLILYAIELLLEKLSSKRILFFVFSILLSFSAGHLQIFGFVFIFSLLYSLFRINTSGWKNRKKQFYFLVFFVFYLLSVGICSVKILPIFELIKLSSRSNQEYKFLIEKLLIQPRELIGFFSPDFFGNPATKNYILSSSYPTKALYLGFAPFIFALFSLAALRIKIFVKFFAYFSFLLLIFLVRTPVTSFFYSFNIPFFATGSPSNAIFLLTFSLSIMAGFGLESWLKRDERFFYLIIYSILILFLLIWLKTTFYHDVFSKRNFIYSNLALLIFLSIFIFGKLVKKSRIVFLLLIIFTVFDLLYFFQKFNPFVKSKLIFPTAPVFSFLNRTIGINRVWGYGAAGLEANINAYYSIFSPDGYDPLYPKIYGQFIQAANKGEIGETFNNRNRSDADIVPGYGQYDLVTNIFRLKILDLLGVKYILDKKNNASSEITFPVDRFKLIYQDADFRVYNNVQALPRIFLASEFETYKNNKEFTDKFFSKNFDASNTILLESNLSSSFNSDKRESARLQMIYYEPNRIKLQTESLTSKLLFISDTFYPGWKAFVDQKETKIYRADFAFRAIFVPQGKHDIVFAYKPNSLYNGLRLTVISIALLIIFIFLNNFVNRKNYYEKV